VSPPPPPSPSSPTAPWPGLPPGSSVPTGPPTVGPPWAGPPAPAAWSAGPPGPPLWATHPAAVRPPLPRTGNGGWQVGLGFLAILLIVAVAVVALRDAGTTDVAFGDDAAGAGTDPSFPAHTAPSTTPAPTTTQPPTTTTAPPTRLAPAPVPPAEPGAHAFMGQEADGDPIAWDPCETIQYVTNSRRAPPGAAALLGEALGKISVATGLVFEDLGPTDEAPIDGRPLEDLAPYGPGWAPVLIAWTDPVERPDLGEEAAGRAGPDWVSTTPGEFESVTGTMHLDGDWAGEAVARGEQAMLVHLLMHELGHLVGLHHVDDIDEVMYDDVDGDWIPEWGPGDLTGLAAVGTGDCDPNT